ncbi:MAG TPA: DUF4407 domain-containing protein [Bacteroidales bacterium]|nr:DUF4407 domain-containing protein [Bacteroidales bacterium]
MSDEKQHMTRSGENQPDQLSRGLWWFSTSVPESIKECESDRNRSRIIGLGVMFTWLYATIAWTYFWSLNIDNPFIYVALGIFLGFGILTIDRMLIASINKYRKNLFALGFRIILALFLGAFIAQPLVLWMFEQDIDTEISILQDRKVQEKQVELEQIYSSERNSLENRRNEIVTERSDKYGTLEVAEQEYLKEIDGTGGSMRYGIAGVAVEKQKALQRAQTAYNDFVETNNDELASIDIRMNEITANTGSELDNYRNNVMTTGFLIRIEALRSLFDKDSTHALRNRYLLIMVILVMFELLPVISKLFLPTGSYDEKVRIRDEIEIELAKSNKSRELNLKHLYNELSGQEDSDLIRQMFAVLSEKRIERINGNIRDWQNSEIKTVDELWTKIKSDVLSKQEN